MNNSHLPTFEEKDESNAEPPKAPLTISNMNPAQGTLLQVDPQMHINPNNETNVSSQTTHSQQGNDPIVVTPIHPPPSSSLMANPQLYKPPSPLLAVNPTKAMLASATALATTKYEYIEPKPAAVLPINVHTSATTLQQPCTANPLSPNNQLNTTTATMTTPSSGIPTNHVMPIIPSGRKWEDTKTKWDIMYEYLRQYKEIHGDCLVPNRYKPLPQLGSWVSTQRRHYKAVKDGTQTPLTQERIRLLQNVGFTWATRDPRHVPWEFRYKELCQYKEEFGDCLVPVGYKPNPQLSNWVSTQRQEWKILTRRNGNSRLTEERINLLNKINFVWEAQRGGARKKGGKHTKNNQRAPAVKRKHPSDMPENPNPNPTTLPTQTTPSTTSINTKRPKPQSQIQPQMQPQTQWNNMFIDLLAFKSLYGHTNVPTVYPLKPEFGKWVSLQRQIYLEYKTNPKSASILKPDQISRLESIGFSCNEPPIQPQTTEPVVTPITKPSQDATPESDIFADASDDEDIDIYSSKQTRELLWQRGLCSSRKDKAKAISGVENCETNKSANGTTRRPELELVRAEAAVTLLSLLKDGSNGGENKE